MALFLDAVLLAVIVAFTVFGSRKGFVKAFLDGFSTLIAGVLAYSFVDEAAKFAYDSFARNLLRNRLENAFTMSLTDYNTIQEKVEVLIEKIPESAVNIAGKMGVNITAISDSIIRANPTDQDVIIDTIMVNVVDQVIMPLIEAVTLVVLFIAFVLVLSLLTHLLDGFVKKMPVIKGFDKILGGGLGLLKGIVVVFVACAILAYMASSSADTEFIEMVAASKILGAINENNPLLVILK